MTEGTTVTDLFQISRGENVFPGAAEDRSELPRTGTAELDRRWLVAQ
ncbi:hypothetical protein [Nocardia cyriacigeorgica]|nr:hypothetical protein [Nocardia cyriacigeorgica]